jgi:hypothetical protein
MWHLTAELKLDAVEKHEGQRQLGFDRSTFLGAGTVAVFPRVWGQLCPHCVSVIDTQ